jgi:quercetin dioxygenase-like cupin family protein
MTERRAQDVQQFIDALKAGFEATGNATLQVMEFRARLFGALSLPSVSGNSQPVRLPVCSHLDAACQSAKQASPVLATLAGAFEFIAPRLAWKTRPSGGPNASSNWPDNHANAVIIGQGGLEERSDVAVGASLMAPNVRYPDHTHPPEELYIVLAPGRFQHGDEGWCEPGPGGTFHNPPGIKHAMASVATPLLAIWTMINR